MENENKSIIGNKRAFISFLYFYGSKILLICHGADREYARLFSV